MNTTATTAPAATFTVLLGDADAEFTGLSRDEAANMLADTDLSVESFTLVNEDTDEMVTNDEAAAWVMLG